MFEKLLAKQHIQNLDLGSVRANAMTKLGWSSEKAQRVENSYRRFLYALAHKKENDLLSPPSQEVDDFWHQHILDTRKYREDCNTVFGHYIDHTPRLLPEDQRRADARREQVYRDYDIDAISFATPNPRRSRDDDGGYASLRVALDIIGLCGHRHWSRIRRGRRETIGFILSPRSPRTLR